MTESDALLRAHDFFSRARIPSQLGGDRAVVGAGVDEPAAAAVDGPSPMQPEAQAVLRALFVRNFAFIWRILRRLGVPPQNVDDAAQQVFYVAARKIESIDPEKARSFLVGTAIRTAAEIRRVGARGRETTSELLDAEPSAEPSPEQLLEKKRALEFLDAVLEAMPFELRMVFVLYEIEGMSTHEVAPALSLPRGTVASRLRRARLEFQATARRMRAKNTRATTSGGAP